MEYIDDVVLRLTHPRPLPEGRGVKVPSLQGRDLGRGRNHMSHKKIITGQHIPPELLEGARQLRQNMTPAEAKLW